MSLALVADNEVGGDSEYVEFEAAIDAADSEARRNFEASALMRWHWGCKAIAERKGKRLPNGRMVELVKLSGKSKQELGYRMQLADAYPTEGQLSNALDGFTSWRELAKSLSKKDDDTKGGGEGSGETHGAGEKDEDDHYSEQAILMRLMDLKKKHDKLMADILAEATDRLSEAGVQVAVDLINEIRNDGLRQTDSKLDAIEEMRN